VEKLVNCVMEVKECLHMFISCRFKFSFLTFF